MGVTRTTIYNRYGSLLAEIEPSWEFANWRLNAPGVCRFSMPWNDPKCTRDYLRYGNRLLVEFDVGLPNWAGVIDVPRRRTHGWVVVTGYTGERMLDWRITAKSRLFDSEMPGAIFSTLMGDAEDTYPLGLPVSSYYGGGIARSLEYHYQDLLLRITKLSELAGHDFVVTPAIGDDGRLGFETNWYHRRGTDKSSTVWLLEGANVEDTVLDEQGPLANHVVVIGEGTTWDDDRLVSVVDDPASVSEYGYREHSEVQSGIPDLATLEANAQELLTVMKEPTNRASLRAVSSVPALFSEYDVGDIVGAKLFIDSPEWYFDGKVRVMAREWTPGDVCRLEVKEWAAS